MRKVGFDNEIYKGQKAHAALGCLVRKNLAYENLISSIMISCLFIYEIKRGVIRKLLKRCNMILNKFCQLIIETSISVVFKDNDMIRFMGEYVPAKETLQTVWFEDVRLFDNPFLKVWFSVTRFKEAIYFKFKKSPSPKRSRPSGARGFRSLKLPDFF
ncbi:hypothetical protein O1B20_003569 [Vibrio cholerae]|nr:hypothetical protein [Vibrio cholerae]